ncbi:MAG: SOS response-associated peptidase [Ferruginibacter sp.]
MCNFLGYKVSASNFLKLKKIEKELGSQAAIKLLTNGFDYGETIVLRPSGQNDFEIVNMHWEFIPSWIHNLEALKESRKKGIPMLNATSEKLLTSKVFRDAALHRRCLVPASHFFDWRHFAAEGTKKSIAYPYCIKLKEEPNFYMAGIWQTWTDKSTGEVIDCFAIVTTRANNLMAKIHNKKERMPVILTEDLAWEWIFDDLSEERISEISSYQYPESQLHAYTLRKDFKLLADPLEFFEYTELPSI